MASQGDNELVDSLDTDKSDSLLWDIIFERS